jgi:O-antigen ligase
MSMAATTLPGRFAPRPRDNRFWTLTGFCAWMMVFLMVVPADFNYSNEHTTSGEGNPTGQILWLVIMVVGWAVAFARLHPVRQLLRETNVFFRIFVVLALLSVAWSIDPATTLRRDARLMIMVGAFLAFGVAGWHRQRFQNVIRPILTILLFGSIVFCLVNPDAAIHHYAAAELINAWHGLALSKNALGALSAFGVVFWVHALLSGETAKWRALVGVAIAGICLVMCRSSTSLIATVFTVFAMAILMRSPGSMRRSMRIFTVVLAVVILTYSIAVLRVVPGLSVLLEPIPLITGKDLTFTGRSEIWALVVKHIEMRPLLGSGYGAYWTYGLPTPNMESAAVIAPLHGFYPGNSHNGYLDVLNDLGAVGLVCLIGYLTVFLRQSLRLYSIDRVQGALYLALLLLQAIVNLSEARWFNNTIMVDFAIMSFATIGLARSLRDARMRVLPDAGRPDPARRAPAGMVRAVPLPPGERPLVRPANRAR